MAHAQGKMPEDSNAKIEVGNSWVPADRHALFDVSRERSTSHKHAQTQSATRKQHNSTGPGRISFRSHRTSSISQASHVCSKAKATSPGSIAKPHLCHSWHSNARAKDVSLQKEYLRALRSRNSSYFTTQITRITAPRKTAAAKTPIHQIGLYRSIWLRMWPGWQHNLATHRGKV